LATQKRGSSSDIARTTSLNIDLKTGKIGYLIDIREGQQSSSFRLSSANRLLPRRKHS